MTTENVHFFFETEPEPETSDAQPHDAMDYDFLNEDDNNHYYYSQVSNNEDEDENYQNYTVKQLLIICDYYNIAKDMRTHKFNKCDILNALIIYENKIDNFDKVSRRKQLWAYINELKHDKFMKKYVLW
jgi:hypothetical protein